MGLRAGEKRILYEMLYAEAIGRYPITRGNLKIFDPLTWHIFAIERANYILAAIGETYD